MCKRPAIYIESHFADIIISTLTIDLDFSIDFVIRGKETV